MTPGTLPSRSGPPVPGVIRGLAALTRMVLAGDDMSAVFADIRARLEADPDDAAALMDAAICRTLAGAADDAAALRARAIDLRRIYHLAAPHHTDERRPLRLLGIAAPGDFMANTPVEFLLGAGHAALDLVYALPGHPLPAPLPEHDVAMVLVGEAKANHAVLGALTPVADAWPGPLLNHPRHILRTSREAMTALLSDRPGVFVAPMARVDREALAAIAGGRLDISDLLGGAGFPVIVRPDDSHAGQGLARLDEPAAAAAYLDRRAEPVFSLARFVDYRSADGQYRKLRLAFIDGRAYLCHLSIGPSWVQHYATADMTDNESNRREEAAAMAGFEDGFARTHAVALAGIAAAIGLDYFCIDCAETPDGRLFVFEGDNAMIIHDMDPVDRFAYKKPQMAKIFAAFQTMLRDRAAGKGGTGILR